MSDLVLHRGPGTDGLYTGPSAGSVTLYYQSLSGAALGDTPDPGTLWDSDEGCWFTAASGATIADPATFKQHLQSAVGKVQPGSRWFAWIADPNASAADLAASLAPGGSNARLLSILKSSNYQVIAPTVFPFGNVTLNVAQQATVVLDTTNWEIQVTAARTVIALHGQVNSHDIGSPTVAIPLTGDHVGTITYEAAIDSGDLYSLFLTASTFGASPGPEFLYTYGKDAGATSLRYPFFMGAKSQGTDTFYLAPRWDPLNPRDALRTNISLDVSKFTAGAPATDFFFTPVGNQITLNPQPGSGFTLGGRYDNSGQTSGDFVAYLVPGGNYMVEQSSTTPKIVQMMCGLWGTEFLLAAEGDLIEFSTLGAAAAAGYAPGGGAGVDTSLSAQYDTAYLRLVPGGGTSPFTGDIKQSYCVLAVNSVYYNCATHTAFPIAIGCRIADLSDPDTTAPFPMVPYGAVYAKDVAGDFVDAEIEATTLQSYEVDVIAAARRGLMPGDYTLGPIFFSLEDNQPLKGGTVRTGTGLVVDLNDGTEQPPHPGTWKRMRLAKSTVNDDQYLEFNASDVTAADKPKVVSPYMSNSLLQGAPFLVIGKKAGGEAMPNGRTPLGGFANELQMGEFTFKVDVSDQPPGAGTTDPTPGAIIIFKYSSHASVLDLYDQEVKWTAADTFVGDAAAVAALQARIKANFVAAGVIEGDGNPSEEDKPLFEDFCRKMTSKEWTGMVVLDCPLDYSVLPIDIQMLLGGIKQGVLNAHHFGYTSNQLKPATDPDPCDIDQSSLFGLIHHDEPLMIRARDCALPNALPVRDPDFQLLKLNALYVNSTLTHFDSRIAVAVDELFGNPTTLQPNAKAPHDNPGCNVVAIDGKYQKRGKTGVVVFETDTPRTFQFTKDKLRALDEMLATHLALTPTRRVPATPSSGAQVTIYAAVQLGGQLGFRDDITTGQKIDLFSYDVPNGDTKGLGFSLYNLDMTTNIPAASAEKNPFLEYPITTDVGATTLDSTSAGLRTNSLIATYPVKLLGLRYDANGMTADSIGGKAIAVKGENGDLPAANPVYALDLKMIMGSAGNLQSDKTPLEGSLLVGWKPGGNDSTDDGFGILFDPPDRMGQGDSLALEGSISTVFGEMTLATLKVGECGASPNSEQFILEVADVVFWIIGLPFGISGAADRHLTMFGDPAAIATGETRLGWFLGVPGEGGEGGNTELSTGFVFTPVMGFMDGLKVNTDLLSTLVIQTALSQLTTITTIGINQVIESICQGKEIGETKVTYDPSAGVLFFLNLDLTMFGITIQALFADPEFYGGRIAFAAPSNVPNLAPFLKKLSGLAIEFDYRKVSDSIGVYSFDVVFGRKDSKDAAGKSVPIIKLGEAEIVLPSVGVSIWTDGAWKVAVGWPFSSTKTFVAGQPLKIFIEAGPWPLEFQAGFYAANVHAQDVPAVFGGCPFGLIKMGGAGLAGGLGKEFEMGPVTGLLELYVAITVQVMTASIVGQGSNSQGELDYLWFDFTIGVTFHAEGSLNLAIIKASLDLEAAIEVAVAAETSHQTHLVVEAGLKVDLSVHIIFFTIHIRFTLHFTIVDNSYGPSDWPVASTEGPTPKNVPNLCKEEGAEPGALAAGEGAN